VDAVTAKHIASDAHALLQQRALMQRREYGWCYDVWPEQPAAYAHAGANGRFSLTSIGTKWWELSVAGAQYLAAEVDRAVAASRR